MLMISEVELFSFKHALLLLQISQLQILTVSYSKSAMLNSGEHLAIATLVVSRCVCLRVCLPVCLQFFKMLLWQLFSE